MSNNKVSVKEGGVKGSVKVSYPSPLHSSGYFSFGKFDCYEKVIKLVTRNNVSIGQSVYVYVDNT